jgi:hypothetical protein
MAVYNRHFTLEEARGELPDLRAALVRIRELLRMLEKAQSDLKEVSRLVQTNGHGPKHPEVGPHVEELQELTLAITKRGIQIKDLERGLVDFPHWKDGREVLLCWLDGEEDIAYWHPLDSGFAGRRRIS